MEDLSLRLLEAGRRGGVPPFVHMHLVKASLPLAHLLACWGGSSGLGLGRCRAPYQITVRSWWWTGFSFAFVEKQSISWWFRLDPDLRH